MLIIKKMNGPMHTLTIAIYSVDLRAQFNHGRSYYGTPYDSTQGLPNYFFIGIWILIILFFIRLAWEYRDEIFKKK